MTQTQRSSSRTVAHGVRVLTFHQMRETTIGGLSMVCDDDLKRTAPYRVETFIMKRSVAIIAVYNDKQLANVALEHLVDQLGGRVAITLAGTDRPNSPLPITLYKANNRARVWGRPGKIWEKQWPLFSDGISIPSRDAGALYVLGYMASAVIACVDGHAHVTGENAFASALLKIGIPSQDVAQLQTDVEAGRSIIMANLTDGESRHVSQPIGAVTIRRYNALDDAPAMPPLREDFHVEMNCQG